MKSKESESTNWELFRFSGIFVKFYVTFVPKDSEEFPFVFDFRYLPLPLTRT